MGKGWKTRRHVRFLEEGKQEELVKLVSRLFGRNWPGVLDNLDLDYHPTTFGGLWMREKRNLPEGVFNVFLAKLSEKNTEIQNHVIEYQTKFEKIERTLSMTQEIQEILIKAREVAGDWLKLRKIIGCNVYSIYWDFKHRNRVGVESKIVEACIELIENNHPTVVEKYKMWYTSKGMKLGYIKGDETREIVNLGILVTGSRYKLAKAINSTWGKFQNFRLKKYSSMDTTTTIKILNLLIAYTNTIKKYVEDLKNNTGNQYVIIKRGRKKVSKGRKLSPEFFESQREKNRKLIRLVKTLFEDYWGYITVSIREYPLIFSKVDSKLRKYLAYTLIKEVGFENLKLIEKAIKQGGIDDFSLKSKKRKLLYKLEGVIKIRGLDNHKPFLYVDVDHLRDYALKQGRMILERIRSRLESFPQNYYQCGSCRKFYGVDELFEVNYRCSCGSKNIMFMEEHPDKPWIQYVFDKISAEIPS